MTLLVLILVAYAAYVLYLPRVIANNIKADTIYTSMLPEQAIVALNKTRTTVNHSIKQLSENTEKLGISYQELVVLLDEVDAEHVEQAALELSRTPLKDKNQAFDIIKKHIKITSFDIEKLRQPFLQSASLAEIQRVIKQAQAENLINQLTIALLIETAKQILIDHQQAFQ